MRRFLSLIVNLLVSFFAFAVTARMLYRFNDYGLPVKLLRENLEYLKYFTVLSNLLAGLAATAYSLALMLRLCRVTRRVPLWVTRFKHISATLMAVTFLVVIVYIGPKTRFRTAYAGANLFFHMILPVLAVADFALLDREAQLPLRACFASLLPIAAYGGAYLGNLIVNGWGGRSHPNDWYGFADGGPAGAYITFAAMLAGGLLVSAALLTAHGARPATHE